MKTPIDFSGLVSLFDPKVEAEGAALLARKANWEADTRKTGYEADILKGRIDTLAAKPEGMSELAYWASRAAGSSTPESIIVAGTRQGAYDAAMSGDPTQVRLANNYIHGAQPVSAGPSGLLQVHPVTGIPSLAATDYSQSMVLKNNAMAQAAIARANKTGSTESNDPLFKPRVPNTYSDEAGEISRLFSYKDEDGNTVNPSEVDVIQKIIDTENALIQAKVADRTNARDMALGVLGWSKYRKPDHVEKGTFTDTTTKFAEPAAAAPVDINAHGDVGNIPEVSVGSLRDPNGPVMQAGHGEHFKLGNTIFMKVIGRDGRSSLQRVQ